ncbi:MAG: hypothetical protein JWM12_2656 [Ilumatobacteraceae bacterium]|nr:hypothetical protein [Ilumatobacteraceae bacterium]
MAATTKPATKRTVKATAAKTSAAKKTTAAKTTAAKTTAAKTTAAKATAATKKTAASATTAATRVKNEVEKRRAKQATTTASRVEGLVETAAAKATEALKSFPSIDFSNFDLDTLKQLDPRKIEWSKIERPEVDGQKLLGAVRDAAYVTVGFGVLAVQKAQVRRRELATTISERFGVNKQQVEDAIAAFEARLTKFDQAVEASVDHAVGIIGERLPDQAEMFLNQVNSVAKTARRQVRGLLSSAA